MSTSSRLGVVNEDGSVTSVYCHWDGDPDCLGVSLESCYKNVQDIQKLMSRGDLSAIESNVNWENEPHSGPLYYADKGEDCPAIDSTYEKFLELCDDQGCDYFYLFKGGQWVAHYSDGEEIPRDEWDES
jgi:hypothetical protein